MNNSRPPTATDAQGYAIDPMTVKIAERMREIGEGGLVALTVADLAFCSLAAGMIMGQAHLIASLGGARPGKSRA